MPNNVDSGDTERKDLYKEINGICCSCGYAGNTETLCTIRKDRQHCVHWWEGPDHGFSRQKYRIKLG